MSTTPTNPLTNFIPTHRKGHFIWVNSGGGAVVRQVKNKPIVVGNILRFVLVQTSPSGKRTRMNAVPTLAGFIQATHIGVKFTARLYAEYATSENKSTRILIQEYA